MRQNIILSHDAFFYELSDLESLTTDMATTNNTLNYMQNSTPEYTTSNSLINSHINLILLINPAKKVVYSKAFDLDSDKEINISNITMNYIINENLLIKNASENTTGGVLLLPEGPMIIASAPVYRPGSINIEGTLVVGRYLNETQIGQLKSTKNLSLTVIPFSSTDPVPIYHEVSSYYSQDTQILINPENQSLTGYSILRDNFGKAVFELKVTQPRNIYNQSINTLYDLIISFLIVGLVLIVTTILFLDKIILYRLNIIIKTVLDIAGNSDISKRLFITGKDELSKLANSINQMLASLELSQQEIQDSRMKYKTIFMNTGTATLTIEEDGKISLVNAEFEKLSGYSKKELVNKKYWMEFFKGEDLKKVNDYHSRRIEGENVPRNYEINFIGKYNISKFICLTVAILPGTKRKLISCLDITELKNSEEKIKNSLKEKELLIREIHHRVKNNMQIIISLLSLQSGYTDDENTKNILRDCQNRVQSMGMIHESLYSSNDLTSINFSDYIKKLIKELIISYGVTNEKIKFKIDIEDVKLSIDTAIPCGLLINELISNSLKHAFPNGEGEIYVYFHKVKDDNFKLIIGDNGIGFPPELDLKKTTSLGLSLVDSLAKQLDATIELHKNGKTEFVMNFSPLNYKERL